MNIKKHFMLPMYTIIFVFLVGIFSSFAFNLGVQEKVLGATCEELVAGGKVSQANIGYCSIGYEAAKNTSVTDAQAYTSCLNQSRLKTQAQIQACSYGFAGSKDDIAEANQEATRQALPNSVDACVRDVSQCPNPNESSIVNACRIKIKKTACVNALKKANCQTVTCVQSKARTFKNVVKFCQSASIANPQNCNTNYDKTCGSKTGAELKACQDDFKKKVLAANSSSANDEPVTFGVEGTYQCGKGATTFKTKINFGCQGQKYSGAQLNPIVDLTFALVRFLATGVGLILVLSIIIAGIQYTSSQGSAEKTAAAKDRITNTIIALIFYLLIFALANFLVPGGIILGG